MNSTALLLSGLGLQAKAARMAEVEKLILSICACTGLSPDEVVAKTKGWCLDTILKVAALTGECMSVADAEHINMVQAITAFETGRKLSEIKALL
ncbi:MAG: hypothetical protein ACXABD_21335 [Candidatus Thorarchaeota archaeon]|jgi:hypothetical protein